MRLVVRGLCYGLVFVGMLVVVMFKLTQPDVTPWANYIAIGIGAVVFPFTVRCW